MPLCLTIIDLNKAFDSVETEVVPEALGNQGIPTQHIKVFRELYSNFTSRTTPFYDDITIDAKRGVRQGDTVSPKLFIAYFDDVCGKVGLQLNLTRTIFMKNGQVPDAHSRSTERPYTIYECSNYVYLGREINMMNDLAPELDRRKRGAWDAHKSIENVVKKTKNNRVRVHLFNTTVLPSLTYASGTWALRKHDDNAGSVVEGSVEEVTLGITGLTQVRAGIWISTPRQQ